MNSRRNNFVRQSLLAGAALVACAGLALLSGCKGNTTSAAYPERIVPEPPTIIAYRTTADLHGTDPLTNAAWTGAQWLEFGAPANTTRTTLPARAAVLYDAATLYVAFECDLPALDKSDNSHDAVSVYLDTTAAGNGAEMLKVSVDEHGKAATNWVRVSQPADRPRNDGSPDMSIPVSLMPNWRVDGLSTRVGEGDHDGTRVWAAVVALPLQNLPKPLIAEGVAGAHWKINLLRTVMTGQAGEREQLQSNLSAVHVGEQEFAPYRMANLILGPQ